MSVQNQNSNSVSQTKDDEIDLIALAKTLWDGRKIVVKITLVFMAIGLFVAIFSQKEYTASTTFVGQSSDQKIGGSLGGLAAMAGINLSGLGQNSDISPILYPEIVNSVLFQKKILQTKITISGVDHQITLGEYYRDVYKIGLLGNIKKYSIGLPVLIGNLFKNKEIISESSNLENKVLLISAEEKRLIKIIESKIVVDVNEEDGYTNVYGSMPEPLAAAQLTQNVLELLQQSVIDLKIQKSKEQLEFIKERYSEVEHKYKDLQAKLAKYRDRNKQITTSMAKTKLDILQEEYDLVFGVYKELAKQLEAQYLQVSEDTPVFTVVSPTYVPMEKSKPRRILIVFIWSFIGGVIGVGIVYGRILISDIKLKWNKKSI